MTNARALIIEDEKLVAWSLSEHLKKMGFVTTMLEYGKPGIEQALKDPPDVIFMDYRLPDTNGIEILRQLQPIRDESIFFFMTAYGTEEVSIEALKLGAREYLNKPVNFDEITVMVSRAMKEKEKSKEISILKQQEEQRYQLGNYISQSKKMRDVMETAQKLVQTDTGTILLLGETGTGKDTLARVLHEQGPRKHKPFIIVNCASLSENLLESELFGYEKGAFTDAKTRKQGQVEFANGGTILLDEIGEIPIGFQAKLLRFIETQSFYRVGGTRELKVNVRIIASTNRDLEQEITEGNFREDLYYRLNVITLVLPPLRKRKEDIPLLVNRFIDLFNAEFGRSVKGISKPALDLISGYSWPGNVRELKNALERIFLLEHANIIEPWHLPAHIQSSSRTDGMEVHPEATGGMKTVFDGKSWDDMESMIVQWALKEEKGNQVHAAKRLKISRDQIRYKMKKHGLL
ncbi:MAG: sigma-54-dependent Fis family transcriptional regulator [FCB group bacterium]|nr:sigma-54-dependent Fis family transcriptional regulator [FCB group bacterium]